MQLQLAWTGVRTHAFDLAVVQWQLQLVRGDGSCADAPEHLRYEFKHMRGICICSRPVSSLRSGLSSVSNPLCVARTAM